MNEHHNTVWLSIGSFLGSAGSWLVWFVTSYAVMGLLGFIAAVVSIVAGFMAIRTHWLTGKIKKLEIKERQLRIAQMHKHNNF